jgi:quinoprotein glucose dehydrogenase
VFVPRGSASPDYYGGTRRGDNKWANSVAALRASTGAFVWGFQVVHHDLWDYDVPSQPMLIEYKGRPAVGVTTKIGHVFVLDRLSGKLFIRPRGTSVPQFQEADASEPYYLGYLRRVMRLRSIHRVPERSGSCESVP